MSLEGNKERWQQELCPLYTASLEKEIEESGIGIKEGQKDNYFYWNVWVLHALKSYLFLSFKYLPQKVFSFLNWLSLTMKSSNLLFHSMSHMLLEYKHI